MPAQIATYTQKFLTTRFGGDLLSVDHNFVWNEDDCTFTYQGSVQNRSGITAPGLPPLGKSGVIWKVEVTKAGTEVRECETPPGTCTKIVTLLVQVWETWHYLGYEGNARRIANRRLRLRTRCLEQCCP